MSGFDGGNHGRPRLIDMWEAHWLSIIKTHVGTRWDLACLLDLITQCLSNVTPGRFSNHEGTILVFHKRIDEVFVNLPLDFILKVYLILFFSIRSIPARSDETKLILALIALLVRYKLLIVWKSTCGRRFASDLYFDLLPCKVLSPISAERCLYNLGSRIPLNVIIRCLLLLYIHIWV